MRTPLSEPYAIRSVVECFFFQSSAVTEWIRDNGRFACFWMALEGHGSLHAGAPGRTIGPGNALLLEPGARIRVRQRSGLPVRNFVVSVDFERAPQEPPSRGLVRMNDLVGVTVLARKLVEAANAHDAVSKRQTVPLAEALLLEYRRMLTHEAAGPSAHDGKLIELANRIRLEPEKPWRVDRCAREVGLCRSQFTRLFQRLTANTPMRFIIKCRLQRAARLLLETRLSVSEIAETMGYRDVFYFSKHFRAEMGKPPTRYRADGW